MAARQLLLAALLASASPLPTTFPASSLRHTVGELTAGGGLFASSGLGALPGVLGEALFEAEAAVGGRPLLLTAVLSMQPAEGAADELLATLEVALASSPPKWASKAESPPAKPWPTAAKRQTSLR
jgi:hypothetical protein